MERRPELVAVGSLVIGVALVVAKLVVGLLTGSLGILSEAAHSFLDLAASGFTLAAVRTSHKPADTEHPYGHGRTENLAAFAEGKLHIEGDASKEDVLLQAGIERARGLVSAVDSDERAVYIVLAARAFNPNLYIVARAGRPDSIRRLELAGATRTISPYVMAGHRMAELAIRPAMVDLLDTLHHGEAGIGVEEMVVTPTTKTIGKTIEEAGLLAPDAGKLLAVRKPDGTVLTNPPASTRLEEGDLVIALGTEDQLFASASKLR